jgi:hypothetical protein
VDPGVVTRFPRPLEEILVAAFPSLVIERRDGLTHGRVRDALWDGYRRIYSPRTEEPLSGFTYASGDLVVILLETRHGRAEEAFTLAHEMGHLAKEFLPWLVEDRRQLNLFAADDVGPVFLHCDTPHTLGVGTAPDELRTAAWKREVVANKCAAELMAPYGEVLRLAQQLPGSVDVVAALEWCFGMPRRAAEVRVNELGLEHSNAAMRSSGS